MTNEKQEIEDDESEESEQAIAESEQLAEDELAAKHDEDGESES